MEQLPSETSKAVSWMEYGDSELHTKQTMCTITYRSSLCCFKILKLYILSGNLIVGEGPGSKTAG